MTETSALPAWIAAVAAGVGAASTIAYTVISLRLWRETHRQAKATEEQLALTSRQMGMAEAAFRAATRPVFSLSIKIDLPETMTMQSRDLRIFYTISNRGQTPLLNLRTTISDVHMALSQEVIWGHLLPQEAKTICFSTDISKEVASSWMEQISKHDGQLNFSIGMMSFTPISEVESALYSDWIAADLGARVVSIISSLARK